ncbi:MAG: pyridoxamine 5'-phosphate oxidase family protein [SAR202 cluster bacterium]|nr:pyridoxamine 5'-phosphate oxidase family protein [SAR202 cluster bacterium]HCP23665.1 pyridoxamine 5'-phosphate oxidase [Dehalococcoidia bacterium]
MKVHDYHAGNRQMQDKFGTRKLADRMAERASEVISDDARGMIERAEMFFLATCDERGLPTCSYKGGAPGFVRVLDESTIAFPNYDGNGKYQSMGNLLQNPNAGLLFIDFENQSRLRLQGAVSIDDDDPLLGEYHEAQFIVRLKVTEVYPNCPRYIPKMTQVEPSVYIPKAGRETPQPGWKSRPEYQVD